MHVSRALRTRAIAQSDTTLCANCGFRRINNHFVFVYGTLKRGEANHYWMTMADNGFSRFVSEAVTVRKFPLIIASRHNIPFLLYSPGNGENVLGEVFEVNPRMLCALDEIEDHPALYTREQEVVTLLRDGVPAENKKCWIYFMKKIKPKYLTRPFYKEYSSRGPQGQRDEEGEDEDPPSGPSGSQVVVQ